MLGACSESSLAPEDPYDDADDHRYDEAGHQGKVEAESVAPHHDVSRQPAQTQFRHQRPQQSAATRMRPTVISHLDTGVASASTPIGPESPSIIAPRLNGSLGGGVGASLASELAVRPARWAFQGGSTIMNRVALVSIAGAFALVSAAADAQTPMRIRGTITSVVPGATIFTGAQVAADGKITTGRVAVAKDGG